MTITVKNNIGEKQIPCRDNQTLLGALQEAGVYISALCAGKGTCGKCKVKILEGKVEALGETSQEASLKSGQDEGSFAETVRLACKTCAAGDVVLELIQADEQDILVEGAKKAEAGSEHSGSERNYFIGVDIGTTTIAMALVDEETGEILDTHAALNRQRMHGADVISRIAAANQGMLAQLHQLIGEDLLQGIRQLTREGRTSVTRVVIAANTTMVHLLMGYSCESLGKHPFSSEHLGLIETTLREIAPSQEGEEGFYSIPVIILPGISAFVGSDITADLLICPGFEEEGISLLLDMGTNGEMVIGNKNRLVAASTAAGPAFEGGNITCGTGSIPGAINQVKIMNRRAVIGTIGGKQPPTGICGTGIIEAIAQLKKNRLMDREGALLAPYSNTGYLLWSMAAGEKIAIYQQDIRQLQLAKGAIRAGMEQLMEAFGCTSKEVDKVYLAGGFGTKLPVDAAIEIGLFPEEFKGKIQVIGNGALQGAIAYGKTGKPEESLSILPENEKLLERIKDRVEGLNLALAEGFEERYLKYLNF